MTTTTKPQIVVQTMNSTIGAGPSFIQDPIGYLQSNPKTTVIAGIIIILVLVFGSLKDAGSDLSRLLSSLFGKKNEVKEE
jgi:hypothetical protein